MHDIKHTFSVTARTVYVIVHSTEGPNFGACGDLAQFSDKQKAVMVARALHDAHPGSELKVKEEVTGLDALDNLPGVLRAAINEWSRVNRLRLSEEQLDKATEAAVAAVSATGPNARVALSPESSFWTSVTGPFATQQSSV